MCHRTDLKRSALPNLMVWSEGKAPAAWRADIITALYKRNDSKVDCGNYRPITLLLVPGKVFTRVLLARIKPLLLTNRRPQQSGFATERRTADLSWLSGFSLRFTGNSSALRA